MKNLSVTTAEKNEKVEQAWDYNMGQKGYCTRKAIPLLNLYAKMDM